ncbi:MAG TPA: AAA family ATPase, partial [Myxococcaceae bacterium]|nr:AAA family ATPase [Myxococcaceae bacterium]
SAGIVHRDLKPSNILVGRDGVLRLADFGLAKLFDLASEATAEGLIVGTPAYMAPEQALGRTLTPAADLYCLGVILYEAITGERPFKGTSGEVLAAKLASEAPDPTPSAVGISAELVGLTRGLLAREPSARPGLEEVRSVVAGRATPRAAAPKASHGFVGRSAELRSALASFDRSGEGPPSLLRVVGPSGIGKSALLRAIVHELEGSHEAVVLSGRCHELESIPYKGFDAVMDALRGTLSHWAPERIQREIPPSAADAVPMFPVLGDVLPFASVGPTASENERMRRGREGVGALLRAVNASTAVVLVLDDAQWADAGTLALLEEILTARPRCLRMVLVAYRPEESIESGLRDQLDALAARGSVDQRVLELGCLVLEDALQLAAQLAPEQKAESLVAESGGEPFLLEQFALAGRTSASTGASIDQMVLDRARSLGPESFNLVEVACVAGAPLPERLLSRAAGVDDSRRPLNALVTASLVRRSGSGPKALVYPYHDRIRTGVQASVEPARQREIHLRIAAIASGEGLLNPASLARHLELGGQTEAASRAYGEAARAAEQALAFDSAARMHARVVDLSVDEEARQAARCARARALHTAGRCDEAGLAFMDAAAHAAPEQSIGLQREAVEAFLAFGYVAEAVKIFVPLLEREGVSYPTTPLSILCAFLRWIAETRARTLRRPRFRSKPDAGLVRRSDLAWTGKGLTNVAPQQGVILCLASLSFALRSGDPFRIARGLSFAACGFTPGLVSAGGRYLGWLHEMAEKLDDNRLRVLHRVSNGGHCLMLGEWERAIDACNECVAIAERTAAPTHWEQAIARMFSFTAYEFTGQLKEMERASLDYLRVMRSQGDRVGEVMITSGLGQPLAARHDARGLDDVITTMRRIMGDWTLPATLWDALLLRLEILRALCWGDIVGSLDVVRQRWPTLQQQRLLDLPMVRYPLLVARTSVFLEACAAGHVERGTALADVRAGIRILKRAPRAEGPAAAAIREAALSHLAGDEKRRDAHLQQAIELASKGRMRVVELMARRALALRRGDLASVPMLEGKLEEHGVTDAAAYARYLTPVLGGR